MKLFKILPAAAGVIALTATVSFANDDKEQEKDGFCRTIINVGHSSVISPNKPSYSAPPLDLNAEAALYHVKVTRGDTKHLVLIDAYSGLVVDKRSVS